MTLFAKLRTKKSFSEDGVKTGVEEAFIQLENLEGNGELLLIDGGLL